MTSHRLPITCVCCGTPGWHAGRGLTSDCHRHHTRQGTLDQFPSVAGDAAWETAHRLQPVSGLKQPDDGWRSRAACRKADPTIFWPHTNARPVMERHLAEAQPICAACPVSDLCLAYALSTGQDDGIWAGTSPQQRFLMTFKPAHPQGKQEVAAC